MKWPWDKAKKKVEKKAESVFENGIKELASTAKGLKKDIQNEARKGVDKVEDKAKRVKSELGKEVEKSLTIIKSTTSEGVEELEKVKDAAIRELQGVFTEEAMGGGLKLMHKVFYETDRRLSKFQKNRPEIVDNIDLITYSHEILIFKVNWSDFYSRLNGLVGIAAKYSARPPKFRRKDILDCLEDLGPTSYGIAPKFQAAVTTIAAGCLDNIPNKLFRIFADEILDAIKVPA